MFPLLCPCQNEKASPPPLPSRSVVGSSTQHSWPMMSLQYVCMCVCSSLFLISSSSSLTHSPFSFFCPLLLTSLSRVPSILLSPFLSQWLRTSSRHTHRIDGQDMAIHTRLIFIASHICISSMKLPAVRRDNLNSVSTPILAVCHPGGWAGKWSS